MRTPGPLRVALAIETNGPGGAENMLVLLAGGLRDRGVHVTPIIPAAPGPSWLETRFRGIGFEPELFTIHRPLDPRALRRLRDVLAVSGADLLHSHEFTMGVYGRAASWWTGSRHVVTMHGGTGFAARGRRRQALGIALRLSDATVAVSSETADFLAQACRLDRRRIDVVPNGVAIPSGERQRVRAELGLREDDRLILAVGNLYPVKGHRTLIEAAARLGPGAGSWTIAIAGRGDERPELERMIAGHQLEGRVRLLGLRTDVADLLAAADLFVMPSLSEGLPLALLEAMSSGLPVVASAVGGIPGVVRADQTGVLVPAADPASLAQAIGRLLGDAQLRSRLGAAAGEEIPARFGVAVMVDAYLQIYRRVTGMATVG